MRVVSLDDSHRGFVDTLMSEHFGSGRVVSRGRLHDAAILPGLLATLKGEPVGFLLYCITENECEIVALASAIRRRGVARTLVGELVAFAPAVGVDRLVLVTTNDNLSAQAFYRTMGFDLVAVHRGAVTRARALKPEIPLFGEGGVAIEDELEYEMFVHYLTGTA
ncbi:MAG: GNAT family N-acetyltransferase [Coriobacteriia bacterium]